MFIFLELDVLELIEKLMYRQESLTEKLASLEYWTNLHFCTILVLLREGLKKSPKLWYFVQNRCFF